jgi:hypothetical protein
MDSPAFRKHRSPAKWEKGSFALPNKLVQDLRLTDSAFRLLAWMVSCAPDWEIYQSDIMKRFKWGETKLRAAIDNLIECKYLIKLEQIRKEGGGWGRCDYEYCALGFSDDEIKEFQINSPYPGDRGTGDRGSGDQGTKQVLIETNPNLNTVCIADASLSDKIQKNTEPPKMQEIRRIDKKTGRGTDISLGWDDLITHAVNEKKDWRLTEMQEAWTILHERQGFVNDMIEFIAGTITNLRTKTRAAAANRGPNEWKNKQTNKAKTEMKAPLVGNKMEIPKDLGPRLTIPEIMAQLEKEEREAKKKMP